MLTELPKGIRPRGAKFFVDVTLNGERRTATCDTLDAAVLKQAELREDIRLGKGRETAKARSNASTWTLQQALDKCLELPPKDGWRGTSYEVTGAIFAQDAIDFMGPDRLLSEIDINLVDEWILTLEAKGNADATINRKTSALSKLLKLAKKRGGLKVIPDLPAQRKERVGRIRQITPEEETSLLTFFEKTGKLDARDATAILIDTGLRIGELWQVRWEDVDLKGEVLLVHGTDGKGTKNGTIRSVWMTKRVAEVMKQRKAQGHNKPFYFTNSTFRHAWDAARAHMGFSDDKDFVAHVCRHTCASRLVRAGMSLPVVKEWLGHKTIQTTMRYAHLMPQDLKQAAACLDALAQEAA